MTYVYIIHPSISLGMTQVCMKKSKQLFLTTTSFLFVLAFSGKLFGVSAQNFDYTIPNPSKYDSLEELINVGTSLIRPIFILTFGAMVLYGGWVRLTAKTDADKIASSTKIITAAATGFAIAVLAPTIVNAVAGLLGTDGLFTI